LSENWTLAFKHQRPDDILHPQHVALANKDGPKMQNYELSHYARPDTFRHAVQTENIPISQVLLRIFRHWTEKMAHKAKYVRKQVTELRQGRLKAISMVMRARSKGILPLKPPETGSVISSMRGFRQKALPTKRHPGGGRFGSNTPVPPSGITPSQRQGFHRVGAIE
jgi:hypothetical protein